MATTPGHALELLADAGFVYGHGMPIHALNAMVAEIARTDIPVLLMGESGTGKEVYARRIHGLSGFDIVSLKKISCATLDTGRLLEEVQEELRPSSGSGKSGARTLFLDGVHELDAAGQRALVSFLPDGEPRGRSGEIAARLICSTSRSLDREIESGRFRRDLYFRIKGVVLRLPPLRERKEDIPALLEYFLAKHSLELRKKVPELKGDARERLISYDWPGNIRELENLARKMVAVGDLALALGDFFATPVAVPTVVENGRISSLKVASRAASRRAERELILKALEQTHWNRKRAARELQISYKSLLYKIKQIGVQGSDSEEL
jgi:two-component system, NtrC family, response regulator AtoC